MRPPRFFWRSSAFLSRSGESPDSTSISPSRRLTARPPQELPDCSGIGAVRGRSGRHGSCSGCGRRSETSADSQRCGAVGSPVQLLPVQRSARSSRLHRCGSRRELALSGSPVPGRCQRRRPVTCPTTSFGSRAVRLPFFSMRYSLRNSSRTSLFCLVMSVGILLVLDDVGRDEDHEIGLFDPAWS